MDHVAYNIDDMRDTDKDTDRHILLSNVQEVGTLW
jgi:hypothetical protein